MNWIQRLPLLAPISVAGQLPNYLAALPEPTFELCGEQGCYRRVGNQVSYLVYRGFWDRKSETGSWNFIC